MLMDTWLSDLAKEFQKRQAPAQHLVSRTEIKNFICKTINFLYPCRVLAKKSDETEWLLGLLEIKNQLNRLLSSINGTDIDHAVKEFMTALLGIKDTLDQDAEFFAKQDPAAKSSVEVILCYPGFWALCIHRIAHQLHKQQIPILPRIISEYAHEKTGVDIHPGASIQSPLFIDHGTGIVIGETTIIGHHVKIFQGVTLGAPSVKRKLMGLKRHPTVGNHVILYANATILGGDTIIGDHSVIGGNVWITSSVAPFSQIYYSYKHQQQVKRFPPVEPQTEAKAIKFE